ncbi:DUF6083 domain-containing protein [Streptomyces sp. NPDC020192]|uniref:DUF6083 domain-containing protein n=1 Tax=Streptomyces sp. NPDC020192 TaxID=3365066 RepID=UPI0037880BA3
MGDDEYVERENGMIPLPGPGPDSFRQPPAGARQPWELVDRAQAAIDGATGPEPPAPPICPNCHLPGDRWPTYTGRHVLLEPMPIPAHLVPGGHRWTIDSGAGIAWNRGLDEPPPGALCRIPHQLACPGIPLDEIKPWAWLTSVREHNEAEAMRRSDEAGYPGRLPDAG